VSEMSVRLCRWQVSSQPLLVPLTSSGSVRPGNSIVSDATFSSMQAMVLARLLFHIMSKHQQRTHR